MHENNHLTEKEKVLYFYVGTGTVPCYFLFRMLYQSVPNVEDNLISFIFIQLPLLNYK